MNCRSRGSGWSHPLLPRAVASSDRQISDAKRPVRRVDDLPATLPPAPAAPPVAPASPARRDPLPSLANTPETMIEPPRPAAPAPALPPLPAWRLPDPSRRKLTPVAPAACAARTTPHTNTTCSCNSGRRRCYRRGGLTFSRWFAENNPAKRRVQCFDLPTCASAPAGRSDSITPRSRPKIAAHIDAEKLDFLRAPPDPPPVPPSPPFPVRIVRMPVTELASPPSPRSTKFNLLTPPPAPPLLPALEPPSAAFPVFTASVEKSPFLICTPVTAPPLPPREESPFPPKPALKVAAEGVTPENSGRRMFVTDPPAPPLAPLDPFPARTNCSVLTSRTADTEPPAAPLAPLFTAAKVLPPVAALQPYRGWSIVWLMIRILEREPPAPVVPPLAEVFRAAYASGDGDLSALRIRSCCAQRDVGYRASATRE
jgi:hypothetical protein